PWAYSLMPRRFDPGAWLATGIGKSHASSQARQLAPFRAIFAVQAGSFWVIMLPQSSFYPFRPGSGLCRV
ncbi:hypothetical protein, partial [Ancylobacter sp.]|uniref:hypothetical protein n=1 Tax=Ancylobacter sp. TaxID=1872567 RepID=UPI003C7BB13B